MSVQFSRSVVSDSLRPHESQHARPPCPLPTPGVHSDSCPSSQWCHPAISSSVFHFSSCPQSLPASESFPLNQLFAWDGQISLSDIWFANIFSHSVGCLFTLLIFSLYWSFEAQIFFILHPWFPLKLIHMFRSLIDFELIFVYLLMNLTSLFYMLVFSCLSNFSWKD